MQRRVAVGMALLLMTAWSSAHAAIVTNTYCDSGGLELVLQFDDALPSPIVAGSFNGTSISSIGSATTNSVGAADPLQFFYVSGGDSVIIAGGAVAGAGTGVFAGISGSLTLKSVPEPTSVAGILLLSTLGLGYRKRRQTG